ncbi:anthranilate/para-aminobenzoate synthase component II [Ancylobacter sp. 3268]|uniref:hypothetical protein n=1 Tax=Ancylobacter sp. 3268 TaxID=2817752 RepID=UPI002859758B|nr:hypothetical protein [Ancylobacter sp. 3268]MDR6951834.1 anthranilate/para-aminobenzoate synthase component II [Ancylobacter sp. 3268]
MRRASLSGACLGLALIASTVGAQAGPLQKLLDDGFKVVGTTTTNRGRTLVLILQGTRNDRPLVSMCLLHQGARELRSEKCVPAT